jgi:adenylylsulfate kinase-like enzyme
VEVKLKFSFQGFRDAKSFQDSVKNHQYVTQYLKEPLEACQDSEQKPLYDKTKTKPITVATRANPFDETPYNTALGEYYCHATLQLISWLD